MSVIIKGIDMPKCCSECHIRGICFDNPFKAMAAFSSEIMMKKPEFCLITELPEKHGRLIDADVLMERLENEIQAGLAADTEKDEETKRFAYAIHKLLIDQVQAEETVIESEGEEK